VSVTPRDTARLFVAGLDHRSSTASLRDRLFVPQAEITGVLAALREAGLDQAILLSTCDRIEVQGAHADPDRAGDIALDVLARRSGDLASSLREQSYIHTDEAALRRIFGVACALESQVIGEPQILGQVKTAHQQAKEMRMMGPELDAALRAAYVAAKRTRTETAIGQRPVTLASAAVQLARDVHGDLARCAGLLVGAGEMGELMAEHLKGAGLGRLAVTGPHIGHVQELARAFTCHVVPFEPMETALVDADIVITALGSGRHVITAATMDRVLVRRRRRPVFIIDLGVPADVESAVEALDGVFRYDLDDLERVTMSGRASRTAAAAEAWAIVEQELRLFVKSRAERAAVPIITTLRRHFELARATALRQAGDDAARATELLINRLLHAPSEALRRVAAGETDGVDRTTMERALAELFRLDDDRSATDEENRK